jgi:hypothetical protein
MQSLEGTPLLPLLLPLLLQLQEEIALRCKGLFEHIARVVGMQD